MKFYTVTLTTNVYSDVNVWNFLDESTAVIMFNDLVDRGPMDGDETTVEMWVFDPTSTATDKTTNVASKTIRDEDEDEEF